MRGERTGTSPSAHLGVVIALLAAFAIPLTIPGAHATEPAATTETASSDSSPSWTIPSAIDAMRGVRLDTLSDEEKSRLTSELDEAWKFLMDAGKSGKKVVRDAFDQARNAQPVDSFFVLDAGRLLTMMVEDPREASGIAREALLKADPSRAPDDAFHLAASLAVQRRPEDLPALERLLVLPEDAAAWVAPHAMKLPADMQLTFVFGVFGPSSLPVVRKALRSPDRNIRRNAAGLTGVFFDDVSAPTLRNLLLDPDPGVRRTAARSLGVTGAPGDVEALGKLLATDADSAVRFNAAFALYDIASLTAVPYLLVGLADPDAKVRDECLAGLGWYHDDDALRGLIQHLSLEPDAEIRQTILNTLAATGTVDHASALGELLASGRVQKREDLESTVSEMRGRGATEPLPFPWPKPPSRDVSQEKIRKICDELVSNSGHGAQEQAEILAAGARMADIPDLERARSATLERLSDECLHDYGALTEAIINIRLKHRLASREARQRQAGQPAQDRTTEGAWWTLKDGRFINSGIGYSVTIPKHWVMKPDSPADSVSFINEEAGAFFTIRRFETSSHADAIALSLVGGALTVFGDKLDKEPVDVNITTVAGVQAQEIVWRYPSWSPSGTSDPRNPGIVRDFSIDQDPADTVLLDIIFVLPESSVRNLHTDIEQVVASFAFEATRRAP